MEENHVAVKCLKIYFWLACFILVQAEFQEANAILKNMKTEVDPCEDFYSFACGGYMAKFSENETKSVYDDTFHSLQVRIKGLLEKCQPAEDNTSGKLKNVYDSCMNEEYSETSAVPDALKFLNQTGILKWPNQDQDFHFRDLGETLGKLAVYDEFAFVNFKPSPYVRNRRNTDLPSPAIILPASYLLNSKMKPNDVEYSVTRILDYFGVDKEEKEHKWREFKSIENTATLLQNDGDYHHCGRRTRKMYIEVNCSENALARMAFPCSIWKSALKHGHLHKYFAPDVIHISCQMNHFHYMENIFSSLVNISHRSLADYLSLRFFMSHLDDLNKYFHMTKKTFPGDNPSESRTPEPISRWEYCVAWIIKSMDLALGYEYVRHFITEPVQKMVLEIIDDYVQELNHSIEDTRWLGRRVKLYLRKQLDRLDIGFIKTMDRYRNKTAADIYYKEFIPDKDGFLKNILEHQKMYVIKKEKVPFNSFYSSSDPYTMDFGLSLFLPPTFYHELPKVWNYATLGCVIGHELSHNFKYFFDFVNLDDKTEDHLKRKMQCYINQYSKLVKKKSGKMIKSKETEEEIAADNLGWALTEKIIKKSMDSTELAYLPGLEYSPMQIMYILFAQDSCAVLSKKVEAELYASKPHNLQNLRVLSVLQNSRTFSETFKCAKNSVMNSKTKCTFFD